MTNKFEKELEKDIATFAEANTELLQNALVALQAGNQEAFKDAFLSLQSNANQLIKDKNLSEDDTKEMQKVSMEKMTEIATKVLQEAEDKE